MSYDDFLRFDTCQTFSTQLKKIARYKFYPTFFNGTWVSDTEILFRDRVSLLLVDFETFISIAWFFLQEKASFFDVICTQFGGLSIRDVSTSSTRTAVSHNQFLQIHPASYKFSADRSLFPLKPFSQLFPPESTSWWRLPTNEYGDVPHLETTAWSGWLKMGGRRPQRWPRHFYHIGNVVSGDQFESTQHWWWSWG